jgi:MFS family permease
VTEIEAQESELLNITEPSNPKTNSDYKNLGRVIQVSLSFFVLFIADNTCQNLTSTVLNQDGLGSFGFYTLASLYLSLAITGGLSAALVDKIGLYKVFVIGTFFHFTFILVSILPAYHSGYPNNNSWLVSIPTIKALLVIAAVFNGFGAAILWCALGIYISQSATTKTKGFFFGLFWFFFTAS